MPPREFCCGFRKEIWVLYHWGYCMYRLRFFRWLLHWWWGSWERRMLWFLVQVDISCLQQQIWCPLGILSRIYIFDLELDDHLLTFAYWFVQLLEHENLRLLHVFKNLSCVRYMNLLVLSRWLWHVRVIRLT